MSYLLKVSNFPNPCISSTRVRCDRRWNFEKISWYRQSLWYQKSTYATIGVARVTICYLFRYRTCRVTKPQLVILSWRDKASDQNAEATKSVD